MTRTVRDLLPLRLAPEMIDRMQSMVGTIDVATETVRQLATTLRPPALDHLGLAAAIELEGAAVSRRTGLRCRVTGNLRTTAMTTEQTTAVFRIVQEALTNVVRHAGASAIRIAMRQTATTHLGEDSRQRPRCLRAGAGGSRGRSGCSGCASAPG